MVQNVEYSSCDMSIWFEASKREWKKSEFTPTPALSYPQNIPLTCASRGCLVEDEKAYTAAWAIHVIKVRVTCLAIARHPGISKTGIDLKLTWKEFSTLSITLEKHRVWNVYALFVIKLRKYSLSRAKIHYPYIFSIWSYFSGACDRLSRVKSHALYYFYCTFLQ